MCPKADAADSMAMSERKQYTLFVVCSHLATCIAVIDNDRKERRMFQHVCHGSAICANETETEVGCGREYKMPPLLAHVGERIPPAAFAALFSDTIPIPVGLSISSNWSAVIENLDKRFIAENVDRYPVWSVDRGTRLCIRYDKQ
jgi:hypothetical protein